MIVDLFTTPAAHYSGAEVRETTGMSFEELEDAIANDEMQPILTGDGQRFSAEDVRALVVRRWSPSMLARLLPPSAVPPLNATRNVSLELPEHQWQVLCAVAAAEATPERPVRESDIVERVIHEWICGLPDLAVREADVPGLMAAMEWPLRGDV